MAAADGGSCVAPSSIVVVVVVVVAAVEWGSSRHNVVSAGVVVGVGVGVAPAAAARHFAVLAVCVFYALLVGKGKVYFRLVTVKVFELQEQKVLH